MGLVSVDKLWTQLSKNEINKKYYVLVDVDAEKVVELNDATFKDVQEIILLHKTD